MQLNLDRRITVLNLLLIVTVCFACPAHAANVSYRPVVTDLSGNTISSISTGSEFYFKLMVDDLRTENATGVFSAYADVTYDSSLVSVVEPIVQSSYYPNARSGSVEEGRLVNAGGVAGIYALGGDEFEVVRVKMTAGQEVGDLTFTTLPVTPDFVVGVPNVGLTEPIREFLLNNGAVWRMPKLVANRNIHHPTLLYGAYQETTEINYSSITLSILPDSGSGLGTVPEPSGFGFLLACGLAVLSLCRRA